MSSFKFTSRVHYGYTREVGAVYDDLNDADIANLSAPRPGLPRGYGERINTPVMPPLSVEEPAHAKAPTVPLAPEVTITTEPETVPPGGGSDGEAARQGDPQPAEVDPLKCDSCGAGPFKNVAGLASHKSFKHKSE